ncbi:hypothetical protein WJX73_002934 [Symbiochloris irregularis]|uniref:procollagen-proline 4-dioxygenase n=1 Tax=Symbiochloris irregularis TaxID=706552 RepID=A0AAW1PQQ4_9CHLO
MQSTALRCTLFVLVATVQGVLGANSRQPLGVFNLLPTLRGSPANSSLQPARVSTASSASSPADHSWVEILSWHPRAFLYHNFLTQEECNHVVEVAKPQMRRSTVVGGDGKSVQDNIRTSYGTFLRRLQDPVVERIERRLESWTMLDLVHQEDMQILRYTDGQKYGAHYDSLPDKSPRIMTVLMYLGTTNLTGGETAFPEGSVWLDPEGELRHGPFSECAKGHVAVRPKKGDALLFYSLKPDGGQDPTSMHTGCPTLTGVKWTATKWIHTKPFNPEWLKQGAKEPDQTPEDCDDRNKECPDWAGKGECDKNPSYMKGDSFSLGNCRLSCSLCTVCKQDDNECRQDNRMRAGFLPILANDVV